MPKESLVTTRCHDLASVQQAVWLDQILAPDVPSYNLGLAWRIDGALDEALLASAIDEVAQANDALRLVLDDQAGAPVQRILPSVARDAYTRPVLDLSGHDDAEDRAWAYMREAGGRPFALRGRVLWECQLVRVGPARCYWLTRLHHLICDGAGIGIFARAVTDAYERLSRGAPATDGPGPSYLELVEKDRAYLASERNGADEQFWRERFAALPPPLVAARAPASSAGRVLWRIEGAEFARLRDHLAAQGSTIQHVMVALLAAYFARTQAIDEVVIGVPVHNRGAARDRRTMGMFSSMIPLGIRIDRERGFGALVREVAAELKRCYRHQRFPIQEIHRALRLDQLGRRQLFDVTLSQEVYPAETTAGGCGWLPVTKLFSGAVQVPLAICVAEFPGADHSLVELNYDRGAFEHDEVERIQRRLARLLTAVLAGDELPVARLPLLDADERRQVMTGWNATDTAYPQGLAVHQLFEAQVECTPDAIAVIDGERQLRYAELNARANQLARVLRRLGVGPDVVVGVCLERSAEMVIALFAALKAGGCYMPLDPDYPPDRLRRMVANSAPRVVLVDAVGEQVMAAVDPADAADPGDEDGERTLPLRLSVDAWPWQHEPAGNLDAGDASDRDLAYVIYTSGSTGTPKGVMNEHRGVVNRLLWMQQAYGLSAQDVVLQKTPFSFDVSVWEFFWPLLAGAQLVMARPHGHKDPGYLAELIQRAGVTTLHFVPSMLQAFLGHEGSAGCTEVARVICSGEALPASLVRSFHERLPGVELHNLYGPTEAAVDVTAWPCVAGQRLDAIPIGRPIANTRIYILDERMQPVPVGVAGEIYIGGVQVARGYLNQPELTAERFVADPFSEARDARLYRTGDLGRWRPDGAIEYLGRNDHQVKIRGVRIELGEIEARLSELAGVTEVVVVAREDEPGNPRLVAYYTAEAKTEAMPEAKTDAMPDAMRAHAAQSLPPTMVPAAYVRLAAMPVTSNGKLDRKALPAPDAAALAQRTYEAPQGETEQVLAAIWAELLQVDRVGRRDSFFALGGHSLLAIRLIERMRREDLYTDVAAIFTAATLTELAAQVRRVSNEVTVPPNLIDRDLGDADEPSWASDVEELRL
jgi:amino acid adenylation domain-containing protein